MTDTVRKCGSCHVCCKVYYIGELGKLTGDWCRYCVQGEGCLIYGARPPACSGYRCAWIEGDGSENDRPDLSGVVFRRNGHNLVGLMVRMMEFRPGALEESFARKVVTGALNVGQLVWTYTVSGAVTVWVPDRLLHAQPHDLKQHFMMPGKEFEIRYQACPVTA